MRGLEAGEALHRKYRGSYPLKYVLLSSRTEVDIIQGVGGKTDRCSRGCFRSGGGSCSRGRGRDSGSLFVLGYHDNHEAVLRDAVFSQSSVVLQHLRRKRCIALGRPNVARRRIAKAFSIVVAVGEKLPPLDNEAAEIFEAPFPGRLASSCLPGMRRPEMPEPRPSRLISTEAGGVGVSG